MDQDFTLLGPSGTKNNPVFNGDMKIIGGDAYTQVEDDGTGGTKVATVDDVIKPISIQLDTVTNTSGSYTHTTQTNYVVASMKPIQIECSNPSAFQDDITVTTANGSITLSCSSVSGTSDVTVTLMKSVLDGEADPEALNPSEFDVLAGRIGNLSSLTTTEKSSVVGAVNEVNNKITDETSVKEVAYTVNTSYVSDTNKFTIYKVGKILVARGYINIGIAIPASTWFINLTNDTFKFTDSSHFYFGVLMKSGNTSYTIAGRGSKIYSDVSSLPTGDVAIIFTALLE